MLPDRSSVGKQKKATGTVAVCRKETPVALRHPGRPTRVGHSSCSSKLYAQEDISGLQEVLWYSDIL